MTVNGPKYIHRVPSTALLLLALTGGTALLATPWIVCQGEFLLKRVVILLDLVREVDA